MKIASLTFFLLSFLCPAADNEKDFKPLFNGRDLAGWRHHGPVKNGNSWGVENGILRNDLRAGRTGTNLYTEAIFWNFALRLEFQVPEGSNSGIFLRGRHEIQITGDYSARKLGPAGNGAIYNIKAPDSYASKPSGEWQSMEISFRGQDVTVHLNGVKIHDAIPFILATHSALDDRVNDPGPIMLQGTHGSIKFRNLRIKELPR